jgi:hypothetical protein
MAAREVERPSSPPEPDQNKPSIRSLTNVVYDTNEDDYAEDPFCKFICDRATHVPPEQIM